MKFIPLGLQCSVPDAIKKANLREYSYPFDWLWCPSKTTYEIVSILINNGVEKALEYMTTGYTYYNYLGNERYISVSNITENQINSITGLGNTHFTINEEYINKLRRRLERLIRDIKSKEEILFIYADAASPEQNYYLDEIEYGLDATEYLIKIYDLLYPINNNIKIIYFCWEERKRDNTCKIDYISFEFKNIWFAVSDIIKDYLEQFVYNNNK